jgi:hypothetical protein
MTYTIKNSDWQWLIEPNPANKNYVLKYKKPTDWSTAREYDTAEEAAQAVASGQTGIPDWDVLKRMIPFPNFASWLIDPNDTFGLSNILG